jgi:hypothetical protein
VPSYEDTRAKKSQDVNEAILQLSEQNTFYGASAKGYYRGVFRKGLNIRSRCGTSFDDTYNAIITDWSRKNYELGNRSNCELTGRYFFQEAQRQMAVEYAVKSGGFLVAHHFNRAFKYGYKFELISLYKIDSEVNDDSKYIKNGIRFLKSGEIAGIFIKGDKKTKYVSYDKLTLVVNKWNDIHQVSGMSPMRRVMEALEYIDNYKAKEMEGAGKRAETPIIIKTKYFQNMYNAVKTKLLKNKANIDEEYLIKNSYDARRLDKNNPQGRNWAYIDIDEDVYEAGKAIDSIYKEMVEYETNSASAAIGLDSATTVGRMHSSYNSALKANMTEDEEFSIVAQEIIDGVIKEIIEYRLIQGCILVGKLKKDDIPTSLNIKYMREDRKHIDPAKVSKALTEDININSTKSLLHALDEKGVDYQQHFDEIRQAEEEILKIKLEMKKKYEDAGIIYQDSTKNTINEEDLEDEE